MKVKHSPEHEFFQIGERSVPKFLIFPKTNSGVPKDLNVMKKKS